MAVAGCCTLGLENASFVDKDRLGCGISSRREILITVSNDVQLDFVPRHASEEVAQRTMSAHIPCHCFVQWSQTQCSVPRCPFTHIFWYLVQLTILRAAIFCGYGYFRGASRSPISIDRHGHSKMVRLLCLTLCSRLHFLKTDLLHNSEG